MAASERVLEMARSRLASFGYEMGEGDELALSLSARRAEDEARCECGTDAVPESLLPVVADMAAGEFLMTKKTFAPDAVAGLDLGAAVKQVQAGDASTTFAAGDGSLTPEQRLDALIGHLMSRGRGMMSCHRKIRW